MAAPLNVLFITADQWRGDCLSALGHPVVRTPNLDALAAEGVLFKLISPTPLPAARAVRRCIPGCICRTIDRAPTEPRWTRVTPTGPGKRPRLVTIRSSSATPTPVRTRASSTPGDPLLTSYEGPLPGIRLLCHLTMGDPTPWTDFLRTRGFEVPADIRYAWGYRAPGPDYEDGARASEAALVPGGVRRYRLSGQPGNRLYRRSEGSLHRASLAPAAPSAVRRARAI